MKTRIQMVADLASALQEALIFAFEEGDPVWAEETILKCVKALQGIRPRHSHINHGGSQ
jgi:hypothetical protein